MARAPRFRPWHEPRKDWDEFVVKRWPRRPLRVSPEHAPAWRKYVRSQLISKAMPSARASASPRGPAYDFQMKNPGNNYVLAATALVSVPPLIVFFFANRIIMKGIVIPSLK